MAEEKLREQNNHVDHTLAQISNLVAALQLVVWDIGQLQPDQPIGKERRDAVVGIGDALEYLVRLN